MFVVFVLKKLFVVCCSRKGLEGENCESAFPCQARSWGLDQLQSMPNLHNFIQTASFCFYILQGLVTKAEIRSPFPLDQASPLSFPADSLGRWRRQVAVVTIVPGYRTDLASWSRIPTTTADHTLPLVTSLWGRIRLQATAGRGASAVVEDAGLVLHLRQGLWHQVDIHPHPQLHQEVGGRPEEAAQGAGFRWEEKKLGTEIAFFQRRPPPTAPQDLDKVIAGELKGEDLNKFNAQVAIFITKHYMIRAETRYAIWRVCPH